MALVDNLATEKQKLTSLLESEYQAQSFRDNVLLRLLIVRFLLGELVGSGGSGGTGDASAINQTSVQSFVGAIPSKVLGIQGVVGGVSVPVVANAGANLNTSALATELGGNLAGINNKLPSSLGAKTAVNSISFVPATDTLFTTQGLSYESSVIITRPANTTIYVINSVIGNSSNAIITFPNMGIAGKDTYITDCRLRISTTTIPAGMSSFRLHLYNASPAVAFDTATWDFATADENLYLGYIDLGSIQDLGSNLWLQADNINVKRRCTSTSLFGFLVTNGSFTPSSGLVFNITLGGIAP